MTEEKNYSSPGWLCSSTGPSSPWYPASQASQKQMCHQANHTPVFSPGHEMHTALNVADEHTLRQARTYDLIDHFEPYSLPISSSEKFPYNHNDGFGQILWRNGGVSAALGGSATSDELLPPHMPVRSLPMDPFNILSISNDSIDAATFPATRLTDDTSTSNNMMLPSSPAKQYNSKDRGLPNICTVQPTDNPRLFVFRCTLPGCRECTFTRWYDFHRHYNGAHAMEKTVFWCPVPGCGRSEGEGNQGFPRKDKMLDHVSKKHSHARRTLIE